MGFPEGASTLILTGRFPAPIGGTARTGRIVLTPSTVLVDRTQHAIYSGGGAIDLASDGTFSTELLCDDDPDILPAGWRWRVDEQPAAGVRRTYWIALPSTLGPTVSLDQVAEISAPDGSSQTPPSSGTPSGPAGGALTGTYPNPALAPATIASFDAAGSAEAAQNAAAADATTKVTAHTGATDPHGDRAAATGALTAHGNAADPHGDRAAASTALAGHVAATDPHGDRAAASSALTAHVGATDPHGDRAAASSALASHVAATDPHGDRAAATTALTAHSAAADPHGDRAWADSKFALATDLATLTGTVNSLSVTVGNVDIFVNDCLTRVANIEQGNAFLNGAHYTGPVEITAGGLGTIRLFGHRTTTGAPTSGTWATGDLVPDSAGIWWLCTASGTPGTWTTPTPAAIGALSLASYGNIWTPSDHGLTAWSFDPAACGSAGTTLSASFIYLVEVVLRQAATINRVHTVIGTAGSGLTSGQCLAGLYDSSGTRVGITADQSTVWNSVGAKSMALTSAYAAAAGRYYIAMLFNGTTSPSFACGSTHGNTFTPGNANLAASSYRFCRSASGQTALPTSITLSGYTPDANNLWSAAS